MANPGSNWHRLNDVYYRVREISSNSSTSAFQDITRQLQRITPSPSSSSPSSSPFDSQMAISGVSKTIAIHINGNIELYDCNYRPINTISMNNSRVKEIHWWGENLVIVEMDRLKVYYDYVGRQFVEFNDIKTYQVRCNVDQFFVVLDSYNQIWYIRATASPPTTASREDQQQEVNYEYVEPLFKIAKFGGKVENIVNNWAVIRNFNFFTVLKNQNGQLFTVDNRATTIGNFKFISPSLNSQFVATVSFDNELKIFTSDLQRSLLSTKLDQSPVSIAWCSSDSVILRYKDYLKLVAPGGELVFYFNSDILALRNTLQGLVVCTSSSIELLSKVTQEAVNLFKIGSISNSSILINSFDLLLNHNPKSFQNLKYIPDKDLLSCIHDCLNCAIVEFDPYWQKKLTKAANLGKSMYELNQQDAVTGHLNGVFDQYIKVIQVLNQLREIGIFITVQPGTNTNKDPNKDPDQNLDQNLDLDVVEIVKILNKRKLFKLSLKICQLLEHPVDQVFQDWCALKIKSIDQSTDEETFDLIKQKFFKLPNHNQIDLKPIFKTCFNESRTKLFELLTTLETSTVLQNLNYFKLGKYHMIIKNCLQKKDLDLLQFEMTKIMETVTKAELLKLLGEFQELCFIQQYLIHLTSSTADEEIKWLLTSDKFKQHINLKIETQMPLQQETLQEASRIYQGMADPLNDKLIQKHSELLKFQDSLIKELSISPDVFPHDGNNSIIGTLRLLISLNLTHKITQFSKQFNISPEKLNYHKFQNFIASGNEEDLMIWLKTNPKFPTSGEQNFLVNSKLPRTIQLWIIQSSNYQINYNLKLNKLIEMKDLPKALKLAYEENDEETVEELIKMDPDSLTPVYNEIRTQNQKLSATGLNIKKFNFFQ